MEEWKPIKEYEGLYEVSSYGRIKSLIGQYGKQRETISFTAFYSTRATFYSSGL